VRTCPTFTWYHPRSQRCPCQPVIGSALLGVYNSLFASNFVAIHNSLLLSLDCPNIVSLSVSLVYVDCIGAVNAATASVVETFCRSKDTLSCGRSPYFITFVLLEISAGCPNLRKLTLNVQSLPVAGATSLSKGCPFLEHLDLSHSEVNAFSLEPLVRNLPHLEYLILNSCSKIDDTGSRFFVFCLFFYTFFH